jgi:hypothetical protein
MHVFLFRPLAWLEVLTQILILVPQAGSHLKNSKLFAVVSPSARMGEPIRKQIRKIAAALGK